MYEIIPSFINVSKQKIKSMDASEQYDEFCNELRLKIGTIYSIWKNKLELAKENEHTENMLIEEIKLSTLDSVMKTIEEVK